MTDGAEGPEVVLEAGGWAGMVGDLDGFAARWAAAAVALEPRAAGPFAILLADDATLADLNSRFRGKSGPTNVLSFPSGAAAPHSLGDMALAFETCEREARETGKAFADHFAHLLVHGLLHLIGYDHETDEDAEIMERLEIRILGSLGAPDPYSPDAGAPDSGAERPLAGGA